MGQFFFGFKLFNFSSAYSVFYKRWLENFDQRQLLVIDGTEMISNPGAVVVQTQVRTILEPFFFLSNSIAGLLKYIKKKIFEPFLEFQTIKVLRTSSLFEIISNHL